MQEAFHNLHQHVSVDICRANRGRGCSALGQEAIDELSKSTKVKCSGCMLLCDDSMGSALIRIGEQHEWVLFHSLQSLELLVERARKRTADEWGVVVAEDACNITYENSDGDYVERMEEWKAEFLKRKQMDALSIRPPSKQHHEHRSPENPEIQSE